ncbi:hypothetical protein CGGC5_v007562 [Colletotrichum fructicola Nara gc5]|uniref:Uncharacterized protein n=1 Tax=Colletotrichum fructicola (strain Nara gc5) TaxID=1213859 RepID=A0A7J6J6Y3_COLFN|nr:hypothetical protein CGGC5_v007562 [Colletotrichum fructicola Nara gc5]
MSSFKSKRGQYKAVRRGESRVSSSTNDEERQIPDDPPPIKTVEDELEALRRKLATGFRFDGRNLESMSH